jgi:hypothetical protein
LFGFNGLFLRPFFIAALQRFLFVFCALFIAALLRFLIDCFCALFFIAAYAAVFLFGFNGLFLRPFFIAALQRFLFVWFIFAYHRFSGLFLRPFLLLLCSGF